MFRSIPPTIAAVLLLLSASSDYLFPLSYRTTIEGIEADTPTNKASLPWSAVRRCVLHRDGVLLTSLPAPSRLDAFRGVFLRFATDGMAGDQASVMEEIALRAPQAVVSNRTERGALHSAAPSRQENAGL